MAHLKIGNIVLEFNIILIFSIFLRYSFYQSIGYALIFGLFRGIYTAGPFYIEFFVLLLLLIFVNFLKYIALVDHKSIRFSGLIIGIGYPLTEWIIRGIFSNAPRFLFVFKAIVILSIFYMLLMPVFVKPAKELQYEYV